VVKVVEMFAASSDGGAPKGKLWEVQTSGERGKSFKLAIEMVDDPEAKAAEEKAKKEAQAQQQAQDHSVSPTAHQGKK
jgi:hypothetical protein